MNNKVILKKRNEVVEFLLLDFKTYDAIVIKALIKEAKDFRQWNRIGSSESLHR